MDKLVAMATVEVNAACCASVLSRCIIHYIYKVVILLPLHSRRRGAKHYYLWEAGRARDQKGRSIALKTFVQILQVWKQSQCTYSAQNGTKLAGKLSLPSCHLEHSFALTSTSYCSVFVAGNKR